MEVFSWNHFLSSASGVALSAALFLGAWACAAYLTWRWLDRIEAFSPRLATASAFGALFGVPVALAYAFPEAHGDLVGMSLGEVDGEPVVFARFTGISSGRGGWRRWNQRKNLRVSDGRVLGALSLGGWLGESCARVVSLEGARICVDDLSVRDDVTFARRESLAPAVGRALGTDRFRTVDATDEGIVVERLDGQTETLAFSTLFGRPMAPRQLTVIAHCAGYGATRGTEVEGLLRSSSCRVGEGRFVHHRATAFDDGEHLVSWVPTDATQPAWTTSLARWVRPGATDVRVYSPGLVGDGIAFWLLRENASLVRIAVRTGDGEAVSSDVVY